MRRLVIAVVLGGHLYTVLRVVHQAVYRIIICKGGGEDTQAAVRRLARYTDRPPVVLCAEEDVDPKN